MSESSPPSRWDSTLSLFKPFEIAGGIAAVVTAILWFVGLPAPVLYIGGTLAFSFIVIGLVGHVKFSTRDESLITLGNIAPPTVGIRPRVKQRIAPRTNLVLRGIDHGTYFADKERMFWEMRAQGTDEFKHYCAVLRFVNEPIAGGAGQPIKKLRASLRLKVADTSEERAPVDRGAWIRERYNTITLEVNDSRSLVVAWGLAPEEVNEYEYENDFAYAIQNNHYSAANYHEPICYPLGSAPLDVEVRLVAGDGGYIMYEGRFRLETRPYLRLSNIA